jgi:hypothetical protein
MPKKLFIFDTTDPDNYEQAVTRFDIREVEWLGADSKGELLKKLDGLVRKRLTFDKVLVQTHGHPGYLTFGSDNIWGGTLDRDFAARNYHTLFPSNTKIYFDGCNVASGADGDEFLTAVGRHFLKLAGGTAMAWTSPGYYYWWLPFSGSKTYHWGGDFKTFLFWPGGIRMA